jgi:hypothetical protein
MGLRGGSLVAVLVSLTTLLLVVTPAPWPRRLSKSRPPTGPG